MDDTLFKIILGLISILGTVITCIIVPYIKEKLGNEKLAKYEYWVSMSVSAAEMIFKEQGMGKTKKEYVVNFLNDMFNKDEIVITKEEIEILVESAVKELKLNEKK